MKITTIFLSFQFGKQRIDSELRKNRKLTNHSDDDEDDVDDVEPEQQLIDNLVINYEKKDFHLDDICLLIKNSIKAIVDDEVTKRFDTEGIKY